MGKIFFTSDLHFCHDRSFIYEPRGFKTVTEMNETIVKNWNSVVGTDDDVYVLGDLMLNDNDTGLKLIKSLKGRIHVIRGNHDTDSRMELYKSCYNIVEVCEGKFLKIGRQNYYLCHYPVITTNGDADKPLHAQTICLCGHSHVKDMFTDWDKGKIVHIEMDTNDCTPWEAEQLRLYIIAQNNK